MFDLCVCVYEQSVLPSSHDDSVKDRPRPLSSISRQQRSKTHITRTASGTHLLLNASPLSDSTLVVLLWCLGTTGRHTDIGAAFIYSDFGGGASSRNTLDLDQDLDREVMQTRTFSHTLDHLLFATS